VIHQTALVHSGAILGRNVSIGPYAIVENNVVLGDDTEVGPHSVIKSGTEIGSGNRIYQFASIGEAPQYAGYRNENTRLSIGDRNVIREYATLNRGSPAGTGVTQVGNDNFLMAYVHIAHDSVLGNSTIFANGASLAGHVSVGDFAILGGFTLVHQFCRIGEHSITGIGAVCLKDVPPYIVATGNAAEPYGINTKGLRRRGFPESSISVLKKAYRYLYRSSHDLQTALEELRSLASDQPEIEKLISFVESSQRGIIR
jgi:UDP-N-acetylglucosamine acyltransferase